MFIAIAFILSLGLIIVVGVIVRAVGVLGVVVSHVRMMPVSPKKKPGKTPAFL